MAARTAAGTAPFGPGLFKFLKELKAHNDREWFQVHKARYEADARNPLLTFIGAFAPELHRISKHFVADPRPVGGSMFRLHRDTRFSKDKSPYKTHLGAHFPHRGEGAEGVHGPGFYLHLEPGGSFAGGGLWHPEPATLRMVREAIAAQPKAWKAIRDSGQEILGDTLKRVPQGFPPDHPWAEDLKRKDFYFGTDFTDAEVLSPDFLERVTAACRQAVPLVKFICGAVELPF
ncbi:MAG: DUF2461 domain-containing protein [Acidobacteria bacterium]|nr:DUF2461 domain-containing protein [Acidobacteriota bacterium]